MSGLGFIWLCLPDRLCAASYVFRQTLLFHLGGLIDMALMPRLLALFSHCGIRNQKLAPVAGQQAEYLYAFISHITMYLYVLL